VEKFSDTSSFFLFSKARNDIEEVIYIMTTSVPKLFGSLVFNESVMKDRLPAATFKAFKKAVFAGEPLDLAIANIIANAMKDWALEHNCTHFTHWFQPMTGITAEKHESFHQPHSRRPRYHGIFRQRINSGRA
jgi:glutamine synthetase type III